MMRLTSAQRKMIASTTMLLAVCLAWLARFRPWGWWALGAMTASWLADGLLAKYPPVWRKVPGAFFIGHRRPGRYKTSGNRTHPPPRG